MIKNLKLFNGPKIRKTALICGFIFSSVFTMAGCSPTVKEEHVNNQEKKSEETKSPEINIGEEKVFSLKNKKYSEVNMEEFYKSNHRYNSKMSIEDSKKLKVGDITYRIPDRTTLDSQNMDYLYLYDTYRLTRTDEFIPEPEMDLYRITPKEDDLLLYAETKNNGQPDLDKMYAHVLKGYIIVKSEYVEDTKGEFHKIDIYHSPITKQDETFEVEKIKSDKQLNEELH